MIPVTDLPMKLRFVELTETLSHWQLLLQQHPQPLPFSAGLLLMVVLLGFQVSEKMHIINILHCLNVFSVKHTPGECSGCSGLKLALNLLVRGSNVEHKIKVGDAL